MVPLDDKHWTSEELPERTFCKHEHGLPHNLCQYHALMGAMTLFHTWMVWTKVTFQIMKITWLPSVMKKYQAWKKYPTDIELWFA